MLEPNFILAKHSAPNGRVALIAFSEAFHSGTAHVRAELAKHIEEIALTPKGETYIASGTRNFVGRGSIGDAGGPGLHLRATEFSLLVVAA
jgi:hypothetical protein